MNNLHRFLRTFILLNPCHVVNLIYEQHIYSINSMKIIILTAGLLLAVLQTVKAETKDYTHFVNPMVGTGAVDGGSLAGNTFPGATFPPHTHPESKMQTTSYPTFFPYARC